MDDDWHDFPVILGQGSLHDLSDRDEDAPRLAGMRSVSRATAWALRKTTKHEERKVGFAPYLAAGTKPNRN